MTFKKKTMLSGSIAMLPLSMIVVANAAYACDVNDKAKAKGSSVAQMSSVVDTGQSASRRAAIDPQTGDLISPAADAENTDATQSANGELSAQVDKAGPVIYKSDGSMQVELNGQFDMPLRATIDADGNLRVGHDVGLETSHESNQLNSSHQHSDAK